MIKRAVVPESPFFSHSFMEETMLQAADQSLLQRLPRFHAIGYGTDTAEYENTGLCPSIVGR